MEFIDFIKDNNVNNMQEEVTVSQRLKDSETGKLFKFKIRALTNDEWETYRSQATDMKAKKGKVRFNQALFNESVVIACTVEPNFKNAEDISSIGGYSAKDYLNKALLPGEVNALAAKIIELSGFDDDPEEIIEEAKNS